MEMRVGEGRPQPRAGEEAEWRWELLVGRGGRTS